MTKTEAIKQIRAMGLSVRATGFGKELRITYKIGDPRLDVAPVVGPISRRIAMKRAELMAYYTDDPDDAMITATIYARADKK